MEQRVMKGWYGMKKVEMTEDLKKDLQILQLRTQIDPKSHFKRNLIRKMPKFFQIGTVISGRDEGASYRIRRKGIQKSLLDEHIGYDRKVNHSRGQFLEL